MKNKHKILFWALFLIVLLPVLFYPISTDLGEFLLGGKTIFDGKKIYVDFIDIKPPFCYYLFSLFYGISGNSEIGIRAIDVVWQIITAFSIVMVFKRLKFDEIGSYLSAFVYCLTYSVLQYYNTFQLESLISLPLVWIIYLLASDKTLLKCFLIGALTGLITGLKYSFGIIIFPILFWELLGNKLILTKRIKNTLSIIFSAVFIFLLSSLPLLDRAVWNEFVNIAEYVNSYNVRKFPSLWLSAFDYTVLHLSNLFSFLLLLVAIYVIYKSLFVNNSDDEKKNTFVNITFSFIVVLWISILVEKKFFEYHFARLFLPLSLLSGFGLLEFFRSLINIWHDKKLFSKVFIILTIAFSLFISPVPDWIKLLRVPYYYLTDTSKYDIYYEIPENPTRFRVYQKESAEFLIKNIKKQDKVFIMGIGSNIIYLLADVSNFSRYSMSSFYFYSNAPEPWKKDIFKEMNSSKWLVIPKKSSYPYFTRDKKTVPENINSDTALKNLLFSQFNLNYENREYLIYKHK